MSFDFTNDVHQNLVFINIFRLGGGGAVSLVYKKIFLHMTLDAKITKHIISL